MSSAPTSEQPSDRVIGPLRDLRASLHSGLRQLQTAANAVGNAEQRLAMPALDTAQRYLSRTLLPMLAAEDFVLLPAVDGVLGAQNATDIMRAEHAGIRVMAEDFAKVVEAARTDGDVAAYEKYLLPLLHGLYATIRLHLEAEDAAYLTLLDDHVSESQVNVICENLERVSNARREG